MPLFATEGTHAGEFIVSEANGDRSRDAVVVTSGQNLVAGSVVGVITATGDIAEYNNSAIDGSEVASGILFEAVDATAGVENGVVLLRDCTFNLGEVTWFTGALQADIDAGVADLKALGVIAR